MPRTTHRLAAGRAAVIAIAITSLAAPAAAQCEPEWRSLRGGVEGTWYGDGPWVVALQEFDDGSGRALYAGGVFRTAGGVPARNIARWNGWSWSPVGEGVRGIITSMVVFDDGSGPSLYVGTIFDGPHVLRWDGSSWTTVGDEGPSGSVYDVAVFNDGSGPSLYVVGQFSEVDGVEAFQIGRWDGSSWSPVGEGLSGGTVRALTVFDDGAGSALYAGGNIFGSGEISARGVMRWDGESWSALGHESVQKTMDFNEFAVFDDGSGPALYGASFFCDGTGCPRGGGVLRWDGSLWQEVGGTFLGSPHALEVIDDGSGPALYAGGRFREIGGRPFDRLARWDGDDWSPIGGGVGAEPLDRVLALGAFDEGAGPTLFIGGEFTRAGGVDVSGVAAFGCPRLRCVADCDDDGALDIFDFLCFQNQFAAGDPVADCDGSGSLEFLDFLCFQNAFAAGCP